jgi:hypothetical protein
MVADASGSKCLGWYYKLGETAIPLNISAQPWGLTKRRLLSLICWRQRKTPPPLGQRGQVGGKGKGLVEADRAQV